MSRRFLSPLLLAIIGLSAPALAQEAPSADPGQIVVTGSQDVGHQIRDFVGAIPEARGWRQLSRFEHAICPAVRGLSDEQNAQVVARLRRVAKAGGMAVARGKCDYNVLIVVTRDKHALMEALTNGKPDYFDGLDSSTIRRLKADDAPAVAWQLDGPPIADGVELTQKVDGFYVNRSIVTGSRIRPSVRPQFGAAMVVIDAKALTGLTITQLADYAAMRAYSGARPEQYEQVEASTILKVLTAPDDARVPASLTNWDLGLLRGLYTNDPALYASAQRGAIRKSIKKQLAKAGQ